MDDRFGQRQVRALLPSWWKVEVEVLIPLPPAGEG